MNLVWSPSGLPDSSTKYLPCATERESGADYCLPEGTWTGLCSSDEGLAHPKRSEGTLSLVDGTPRIPGCDEHVRLLWHGTAKPGSSYLAPDKVTMRNGAKDQQLTDFEYAGRAWSVAVSGRTLRLQATVGDGTGAKSIRTLDLSSHFQELLLPKPVEVTLAVVGDLNGDAEPELIVTSQRSGVTRHNEQASLVPIAVMVTLSTPPSVVGQAYGLPWSVFSLKGCQSAGKTCDVMSYLEAQESCQHFAGEEPYDKERAAFLQEKLKGCDKLPAQRTRLLRKYKSNEDIQHLLEKTQE